MLQVLRHALGSSRNKPDTSLFGTDARQCLARIRPKEAVTSSTPDVSDVRGAEFSIETPSNTGTTGYRGAGAQCR